MSPSSASAVGNTAEVPPRIEPGTVSYCLGREASLRVSTSPSSTVAADPKWPCLIVDETKVKDARVRAERKPGRTLCISLGDNKYVWVKKENIRDFESCRGEISKQKARGELRGDFERALVDAEEYANGGDADADAADDDEEEGGSSGRAGEAGGAGGSPRRNGGLPMSVAAYRVLTQRKSALAAADIAEAAVQAGMLPGPADSKLAERFGNAIRNHMKHHHGASPFCREGKGLWGLLPDVPYPTYVRGSARPAASPAGRASAEERPRKRRRPAQEEEEDGEDEAGEEEEEEDDEEEGEEEAGRARGRARSSAPSSSGGGGGGGGGLVASSPEARAACREVAETVLRDAGRPLSPAEILQRAQRAVPGLAGLGLAVMEGTLRGEVTRRRDRTALVAVSGDLYGLKAWTEVPKEARAAARAAARSSLASKRARGGAGSGLSEASEGEAAASRPAPRAPPPDAPPARGRRRAGPIRARRRGGGGGEQGGAGGGERGGVSVKAAGRPVWTVKEISIRRVGAKRGVAVACPPTMEQLLRLASSQLGARVVEIWNKNSDRVNDIRTILATAGDVYYGATQADVDAIE
eukprot:tig00020685_g12970.t1